MKTTVFLILFLYIVIQQIDCNQEKRHKQIHARTHRNQHEHGRRIRRQWSPANYRSYSPYYNQNFYVNREEQLVTEILSLLRQIKLNLSSQRQPSFQPVYVPYPYPVPLPAARKPDSVMKPMTALPSRNSFDELESYSRPISLKPVTKSPPIQTQSTEKVNDSANAIIFPTTPSTQETDPSKCEAAIITCCRFPESKDKKACFSQYSCNKTYATNLACKKEVIQTVVQKFIDTYAPK